MQSSTASWNSGDLVTTAHAANSWQTHLFEFDNNGSSTTVRHFINGADAGGDGNAALTTALGGFILGANGGASGKLHDEIAEILVYNRLLGTSEKSDVTTCLDDKWGDLTDLPFSFASATAVQTDRSVSRSGIHGIAALAITSNGNAPTPAYALAGIDFDLSGTTDLNDISDIRIYESPSGTNFDAGNAKLLATLPPAPGTMRATFNRQVSTFSSYFWVAAKMKNNEAQIVELDDGNLLPSMKNFDSGKKRLWCVYSWNHATQTIDQGSWGTPWSSQNDPTVQGSVERYRSVLDGHPYSALLFANPDNNASRANMSVRVSLDQGLTWPYKRSIDSRPAAYSCMTILPDGEIGLLYETGDTSSIADLVFARFPIEWITGSADGDGDGIPDFHEDATGLDKTDNADALLDSDGDGQTNLSEYRLGTNPQRAASIFHGMIEHEAATNRFTLKWPAAAYRTYRVESSPDLAPESWQGIPGLEAVTGSSTTMDLTIELPASENPRRFYRIATSSLP